MESSQRRETTRRQLLDAGLSAFSAGGYEGARLVEDILKPAGISTGSFYHHFDDKADLYVQVRDEVDRRIRRALEVSVAAVARDPEVSFEDWIWQSYEAFFAMVEADEDAWRIGLVDMHHPDLRGPATMLRIRWVTAAAANYSSAAHSGVDFDARGLAEVVVDLARGALLDFLDTPVEDRGEWRQRRIDGLTRFTVSGVAGFVS